jgi:hypothetical protein
LIQVLTLPANPDQRKYPKDPKTKSSMKRRLMPGLNPKSTVNPVEELPTGRHFSLEPILKRGNS